MKKVGKVLGIVLGVLVVFAGGAYAWASVTASSKLSASYEAHEVDFPVPFPLTESEVEAIRQARIEELGLNRPAAAPEEPSADADGEGDGAEGTGADTEAEPAPAPAAPAVDPMEGVDLDAIALERAVERGRHLVEARYACIECHGDDFAGGTMIDDPAIGTLKGPNLTGGQGSRVGEFSIADWDRAVRHGILPPGGRPSAMPAEDYQRMSDHELSDIIAYVRSFPAVDAQMPPVSLGPVGTFLMATGELPLSVTLIHDHHAAHPVSPPEPEPTVEFGEHLAGICTGCHRSTFEGGPIAGAPPGWLPSRNLTPHAEGLEGWTYEQFVVAMREMKRPDGTALGEPMTLMRRYIGNMTDVELQALWAFMQSLEPRPTGT